MNNDASYISAFLVATKDVFNTMLRLPVTFENPLLNRTRQTHDVSGVIGLSGDVVGSVVIGIGEKTAMDIVTAFVGSPLEYGSPDFADAIGELTNMIVGGAKSKFEGMSVSIGCPTVITAPDHKVSSPSSAASIHIPCNIPSGSFVIDLAIMSGSESASSKVSQNQSQATSADTSA